MCRLGCSLPVNLSDAEYRLLRGPGASEAWNCERLVIDAASRKALQPVMWVLTTSQVLRSCACWNAW